MASKLLAMPDYIVRNKSGAIVEMFCKVCGANIYTAKGRHKATYAEVKMKFNDGSNAFHVTNCCKKCATGLTPATLLAMFHADLDDMVKDVPSLEAIRGQSKPRVVVVNYGGRGTG